MITWNYFNVALAIFVIVVLALCLASCSGVTPASVSGECRVFKDPGFAVRGARLKDSQWIGRTQETGIEVCHWQRPKVT
jgi:hypothetical protein